MIRTDKRMRICTVLLILCLVFIWGNSLIPARASREFSDVLQTVLHDIFFGEPVQTTTGISSSKLLRKIAHFGEFAALGMLLSWRHGMLKKPGYDTLLLGVGAACVDETLQFLAPGRAPQWSDVLLDSSGFLTGMVVLLLGHSYFKRQFDKKHSGG